MKKRWLALLLSCAVAVNTCVVPAAATTVSDAAIAAQQTVSAEDAEAGQADSAENAETQGGQNDCFKESGTYVIRLIVT